MFDSPFAFCPVCRAYVLLDQTQKQCAREYACSAAVKCPLRPFFTGIEFREATESEKKGESSDLAPK